MTTKPQLLSIDGHTFRSITSAAAAYRVSPKTLIYRMRKNPKRVYASEELKLEGITPVLPKSSVENMTNILTWDFVYQRITSSPVGLRVDSTDFSQAA